MISDEKMVHILHLMVNGLEREKFVTYPNKEESFREARKVCFGFVKNMNAVGELARKRIESMKNPPQEFTQQWDILYKKYLEEEWKKLGG